MKVAVLTGEHQMEINSWLSAEWAVGQITEIRGEKRRSIHLNLNLMQLGAGNSELDQVFL